MVYNYLQMKIVAIIAAFVGLSQSISVRNEKEHTIADQCSWKTWCPRGYTCTTVHKKGTSYDACLKD